MKESERKSTAHVIAVGPAILWRELGQHYPTIRMGEQVAGTPLSEPGTLLQAAIALPQCVRSPHDDEGSHLIRGPRASGPCTRQEIVFQLHLAF